MQMLDNSAKKTNCSVQPCDRQAVTVATAKTQVDIDEHYCDRIAVSVATVKIDRTCEYHANDLNIKQTTIWNAERRPMDA